MCRFLRWSAAAALSTAATSAFAGTVYYTDWTTVNTSGGTASGVISVPNSAPVTVDFKATFANGSAGSFFFGQTNGGTNYWSPDAPYKSSEVSNAPPDSDILALVGGENQIYTVTLSELIKDPIMSIVSLGQPSVPTRYDFDAPFTIVSQAAGYWGGGPAALSKEEGDVLLGSEGHGTLKFVGTYSTFSWEVPTPERWHGFTFGIRTTQALEPGDPPTGIPLPAAAWAGFAMLAGMGGVRSVRKRLGS